ncbi:GNAT family N-acetyltransferase [Butyrivibrio sp. VCD2006]|uniref:GNAT family N-acetyltransferase n=1 Tax=Butyrivibrio sp. VCD2006 TaxID=1280664 RepID=UPI000420E6CB|nr:GNAT family N-acetyltransferase [Butyrivibrio sp. VCD2006]
MIIRDFEPKHVEEASEIALGVYNYERAFTQELPEISSIPVLEQLSGNGFGVAAFEGGKMVGFLCSVEPFENAFRSTDVKGAFSPMGANGAVMENRGKIYAAMYEAAAKKWVKAGAMSHAICLYDHDEEAKQQLFRYGFGLRCEDAIRPMETIDCSVCSGYEFLELQKEDYADVYPLQLGLNEHYCTSPYFMNRKPATLEEFLDSSERDKVRFFAAKICGELCAYMEVSDEGETFIASGDLYRHITGAYCMPEHRGMGVYKNLLNYVINTLKTEGYTRLGVDFESINPSGSGFWLSFFHAYTNGVVRRIDERIIQRMSLI